MWHYGDGRLYVLAVGFILVLLCGCVAGCRMHARRIDNATENYHDVL